MTRHKSFRFLGSTISKLPLTIQFGHHALQPKFRVVRIGILTSLDTDCLSLTFYILRHFLHTQRAVIKYCLAETISFTKYFVEDSQAYLCL